MAAPEPPGLHPLLRAARDGDVDALNRATTEALRAARDKESRGAIHHAALGKQLAALECLLDRGLDPNDKTSKGLSPVHLAVHAGSLECIQLLAKRGATVATPDKSGRSPLTVAVMGGKVDLAEHLFAVHKLLPVDRNSDGMDALHFACLGGHISACRWCVERGCSPRQQTAAGWAPLHYAAVRGHMEVVMWLLGEQGVPHSPADETGVTPLHLAATGPSEVVLVTLLKAGADPNRKDARGHTPLSLASARPAASRGSVAGTAASATALMREATSPPQAPPRPTIFLVRPGAIAARFEGPMPGPASPPVESLQVQRAVRGVLGLGSFVDVDEGALDPASTSADLGFLKPDAVVSARVRAKNRNGWGAWSPLAEETSIAALSLAAAAERDAAQAGTGADGATAPAGAGGAAAAGAAAGSGEGGGGTSRDPAAASGAAEAAGTAGNGSAAAEAAPVTLDRVTAMAALSGDIDALVDARRRGVDLLRAVWAGSSDLPAAGSAGDEATEALIKEAALGRTALHLAVGAGRAEAVQWLARLAPEAGDVAAGGGSAVDLRDAKGATAFLLAVVNGDLACARVLAAAGASIDTSDLKGFSALHYAAHKNHARVFCWLLEAGADPDARTRSGKPVEAVAAALRAGAAMLSSARAPPPAPPPAVFLAASRHAIAVELPALRLAPGCPRPVELEVSYGPKFAILTSAATVRVPYEAPARGADPSSSSTMRHVLSGLSPDTVYSIRTRARSVRGWGGWSSRSLEVTTRPASDRRGIPAGLVRGRGMPGDDGSRTEQSSEPDHDGTYGTGSGTPQGAGAGAGAGGGGGGGGGDADSVADGRPSPSLGAATGPATPRSMSGNAARFGLTPSDSPAVHTPAAAGVRHGGVAGDSPPIATAAELVSPAAEDAAPAAGRPTLAARAEAAVAADARAFWRAAAGTIAGRLAPAGGAPSEGTDGTPPTASGAGAAGPADDPEAAAAAGLLRALRDAWQPRALLREAGPAVRAVRRAILRQAAASHRSGPAADDAASDADGGPAASDVDRAAWASLLEACGAWSGAPGLGWALGLRPEDLVAPPAGASAPDSDSDDDAGLVAFGATDADVAPPQARQVQEVDFVSGGASADGQGRRHRRRKARLQRAAAVLAEAAGAAGSPDKAWVAAAAVLSSGATLGKRAGGKARRGGASAAAMREGLAVDGAGPPPEACAVATALACCVAAGADPGRFSASLVAAVAAASSDAGSDAPKPPTAGRASSPPPAAAAAGVEDELAAAAEQRSLARFLSLRPGAAGAPWLPHSAAFAGNLSALVLLDSVAAACGAKPRLLGSADGSSDDAASDADDAGGSGAGSASRPASWAAASADSRGAVALHYAALGGSAAAVACLCRLDSYAVPEDDLGRSPLHWAAAAGQAEALAALCTQTSVAASAKGCATLDWSAAAAAATRPDDHGCSPLHIAAASGAPACIVLLLSVVAAGAKDAAAAAAAVAAALAAQDAADRTPLSIAAATGAAPVLATLRAWLQPPQPPTRPKAAPAAGVSSVAAMRLAFRSGGQDAETDAGPARLECFQLLAEGTSEAVGAAAEAAVSASAAITAGSHLLPVLAMLPCEHAVAEVDWLDTHPAASRPSLRPGASTARLALPAIDGSADAPRTRAGDVELWLERPDGASGAAGPSRLALCVEALEPTDDGATPRKPAKLRVRLRLGSSTVGEGAWSAWSEAIVR
ncbi:hypothetical protein FNF27_00059 [Cafeteria roenbergensis]|uniref:Fibronectin type-III domain-containing protein n=1 Tax=Cafeteria roenbergensis TaxID=33653 RepID=A0A5A8EJY7_CAFRO|nr:hypothetical protein FNF27_00059 [Cafeteria roenbergensis]